MGKMIDIEIRFSPFDLLVSAFVQREARGEIVHLRLGAGRPAACAWTTIIIQFTAIDSFHDAIEKYCPRSDSIE